MINNLLMIALGGAVGALSRYAIANGVHYFTGRAFPYGTLSVNIIGSFLMGFLLIVLTEKMTVGNEYRSLLLVGFLGALTTFSTFSMETLNLLQQGYLVKAILNIALNVCFCLLASWLGFQLARNGL